MLRKFQMRGIVVFIDDSRSFVVGNRKEKRSIVTFLQQRIVFIRMAVTGAT